MVYRSIRTASYEKYLASLLVHAHFLPSITTAELRMAQSSYVRAKEKGIRREDALRMASELIAVLRHISASASS